ncbi:MAG: hypothetical protein H0W01_02775 [Pseudonocardiales bacterium]|nr:hypothetical protein [Pseudonocardiales bacterium]
MTVANLQIRDVPNEMHDELRRRAKLEHLSLREYVLRLISRDQQRPALAEWLERVHQLEPVDLGAPASELIAASRADRDVELLPERRTS